MRLVLNLISILLLLAGVVVFLQGVNILPSGFPSGNVQIPIYGSVLIILAFILIIWINRD